MQNQEKKFWAAPKLEVLDVNQTMAGTSIHSNDGSQGGDDSDSIGS